MSSKAIAPASQKPRTQPPQGQTPDYADLRKQINDFKSTFYGPHACSNCGAKRIVKMAVEQGGHAYDAPPEPNDEGIAYVPHVCKGGFSNPVDGMLHYDTAEGNVRFLLGKVLTIVDATIPLDEQKKAAKDLVRDAFRDTIHVLQTNCFGNQLRPINMEPIK